MFASINSLSLFLRSSGQEAVKTIFYDKETGPLVAPWQYKKHCKAKTFFSAMFRMCTLHW